MDVIKYSACNCTDTKWNWCDVMLIFMQLFRYCDGAWLTMECTINWFNSKPSVLWRCWLGSRKGIRPAKNWVVGCWHGYVSGSRCRFAYGPAVATSAHCLLLQKIQIGFTFLVTAQGSTGQRAVKWVLLLLLIYKAESVCSLFPATGYNFQLIWAKFGMWRPYIRRMVVGMEFYL